MASNRIKVLALLSMVEGNRIVGRKRFQKIVYLLTKLNPNSFDYAYELYEFGPYSRALEDDLCELSKEDKYIKEEKKGNAFVYNLKDLPEKSDKNYLMKISNDEIKTSTIEDNFIQELSKKDSQLLELIATIVYVAKDKGNDIKDKLRIFITINKLKPALIDRFERAFEDAKEILRKIDENKSVREKA